MFLQAELRPTVDQRVERALEALWALLSANRMVICQFSAGKDSGVVTSLALDAARRHAAAGGQPLVCVITADTLVESPEMVEHAHRELGKMEAYGRSRGFEVRVLVVAPSLATSWQLSVLTGRALPSYAGTNLDCSVSLKIEPSRVGRNQLYREARKAGYAEPVVLLGTRFNESERRKAKMAARGDRADTPVRNSDGELTLCPIADWSTEDVWEFIGEVSSGLRLTYTDFEETKRIYAHAGNSSCAIVSDLTFEEASAGKRVRRGNCDVRTGCWTCQQADDRSLAEMIRFDEDRYAYARGLQQLNRFIRAIRYDWSRRNWVGRTIREGYICLEPDTFGAATVRELVRYLLTIDRDERIRARRAGTEPKFQTLPLPMMIAVDAMQSLQGLAAPFNLGRLPGHLRAWRELYRTGNRAGRAGTVARAALPESRHRVGRYGGSVDWVSRSADGGFDGALAVRADRVGRGRWKEHLARPHRRSLRRRPRVGRDDPAVRSESPRGDARPRLSSWRDHDWLSVVPELRRAHPLP